MVTTPEVAPMSVKSADTVVIAHVTSARPYEPERVRLRETDNGELAGSSTDTYGEVSERERKVVNKPASIRMFYM